MEDQQGTGWVGKQFGKLTVISETGDADRGSCLCQCVCGNEKRIKKANLSKGRAKSCGCGKPSTRQRRDLTGQRFGKLIVLEMTEKEGLPHCLCRCDCGSEKEVVYGNIVSGDTQSCGCLKLKMYQDKTKVFQSGERFGRLIARRPHKRDGEWFYQCLCDCGRIVEVRKTNLLNGNTQSCGCLQIERSRAKNTKHGLYHERLYLLCWEAVARATRDYKNSAAGYYGIGVEPDWENDIPKMYYELKPLYDECLAKNGEKNTTIDRINNTKGYIRGNIAFISHAEQEKNKGPRKDQHCFEATNTKTGEKYCCNNISFFARTFGMWKGNVGRAISGKAKFAGDFVFKRLEGKCYTDKTKQTSEYKDCLEKI